MAAHGLPHDAGSNPSDTHSRSGSSQDNSFFERRRPAAGGAGAACILASNRTTVLRFRIVPPLAVLPSDLANKGDSDSLPKRPQ
jgi:hypothetical protein